MKIPLFNSYEEIFVEHIKGGKYDVPVQQYHDDYELYLLLDGERAMFFNDVRYTLRRGDMAVIRPFELHSAESGDFPFYERYVLNFKPSHLAPILSEGEQKQFFSGFTSRLLHLDDAQLDIIYSSFRLIDALINTKNPFTQKAVCAAVISLIMYIKTVPPSNVEAREIGLPKELSDAIIYINEHYGESISLDMAADMAHLSKYHFCRVFKLATGATFLEYLTNVRLSHAHRLLIQTDMSVSEISRRTGFTSAAYFSRMFKKIYGIPPKAARGTYKS